MRFRFLRARTWLPLAALALGVACSGDNAVTNPAIAPPDQPHSLPPSSTKTIPAPSLSSLRSSAPTIATCAPSTVYQITDGTHTVGTVSVGNDATNIYVNYAITAANWWVSDTRLAVVKTAAAVPKDANGQPSEWDFPFSGVHEPPVTSFTYTIPLSKVGASGGTDVYVSAMAGVVHPVNEANYDGDWEWIVMWGVNSATPTTTIYKYTVALCAGQAPPPPPPTPSAGIITLTFDDGFKTTWTNVYPVLKGLGLKANIAVNPTPIDEGWSDYMTLANLNALWADGWSIVSHTMDHQDLTKLSASAMEAEIRDSKAWVIAKGFGPSNVFVVPFHSWGDRERTMIMKYHKYTRGHTIDEWSPEKFAAVPITTPMDLTAFEPEFAPWKTAAGRALTMSKVKFAVDNGLYLDLMFHRVQPADVATFKDLMTQVSAYKTYIRTFKDIAN
jgi:hypothetical protein